MPDDDPNAISEKQLARENSSPIPGCAILATILLVFGGLVVLYVTVGFYQAKKFGQFTDAEPLTFPVTVTSAADAKRVQDELLKIKTATENNEVIMAKFSADDLNTLIASVEKLKDFRGNTLISTITDDGIEVEMSQPIRQMGFSKPNRYLNGTFVFKPEVRSRTIAFKLIDIRQENRETPIPPQFIGSFGAIDFFKVDPDEEKLEPILRKLKRAVIEDGYVQVHTKDPSVIEGDLDDE
ncbi:MAG: hypothetical protein ACKVJU_03780 [Verrucomicrobiales bacterium]